MAANSWTLDDVFKEDGFLSQHLDGYELRSSQLQFSEACDRSFKGGEHLAAEGPCGVGKSNGYLVAAIRQAMSDPGSPKKVVVATANIALQEQLFFKDLPLLRKVLPVDFNFALVKGRNNYACRDAVDEFRTQRLKQGDLFAGVSASENAISKDEKIILAWVDKTETGDKSELEIAPSDKVWRQFAVTAEDCTGPECPYAKQGVCFANKAKAALQDMDVIVVNYHLLFAHIVVRMMAGIDVVLPDFQYLICDEGHKVADIARAFFGWSASEWMISRLLTPFRRAAAAAEREGALDSDQVRGYLSLADGVDGEKKSLWEAMAGFYEDAGGRGAARIRQQQQLPVLRLSQLMTELSVAFDVMSKIPGTVEREKAKLGKHSARAKAISESLIELSELSDDNGVYFMEPAGEQRRLKLVKRLLNVSDMLWDQMFGRCDSVVVTSATLAVDGDCSFLRGEIGLREGREILVESPFNFREQALIVMSDRAPDPKKDDYTEKVCTALKEVINQADGRTLALFTSYRNLSAARDFLRDELMDMTILVQGEAPRMRLMDMFKEDVHSVLLGTESFWAGVDVPGESLSCVTIDRLPFPTPGDPVLDALNEKAGRDAFWRISVPRAILQFRQGVGRLIRRRDDRGVIVVFDNRIITKGYGSSFIKSLPVMKRSNTLRSLPVQRFLAEGKNE